MKLKDSKAAALVFTAWLGVNSAFGCGGDFPNDLLSLGGNQLLAAPEAAFAREIAFLQLVKPVRSAVLATNSFPEESAAAELAELRSALARAGRSQDEIHSIITQHAAQRSVLSQFAQAHEAWRTEQNAWQPSTNPEPMLRLDAVKTVDGLPGEFADYFQGALAWHHDETNAACAAWRSLLGRPAGERHFRSTWAAFMLGKATWETDPAQAITHFREVRSLATHGFADSLGLAVCSLGWEARIALRRGDFTRAIDLYLEQAASGDPTTVNSLRFTAAQALQKGSKPLAALAAYPRGQKVITAYLIAEGWADPDVDVDGALREPIARLLDKQSRIAPPGGSWHRFESPVRLWLEAVESADVRDVESAEKLALAAYQAGEIKLAQRWLKRAAGSPTAQWLTAKLLLRDGKVEQAAVILANLSAQFPPVASTATNALEPGELLLRLTSNKYRWERNPAPTQVYAELGALKLARREYTEALDALLRSGYQSDADYIADRVLTRDELRTYVDRNWPVPASGATDDGCSALRDNIRSLLGLRLIREGQLTEARPYLSSAGQAVLDAYLNALTQGRDATLPAAERAAILWAGAQLVMQNNGLFTAPVESDWRISGGFSFEDTPPARLVPAQPAILPATTDERQRVARTDRFPDRSWYYRFIATKLAWEAAQLMPNNTDETAHVLWQAGTWIKYIDADAADLFYKALVNRCRKTALGDAADRRRWFPSLDENGNILPFKSRSIPGTLGATNSPPSEMSGKPASPP